MLTDSSIARLDQIFTHETATGTRVFLQVTSTRARADQPLDPVTTLPLRTLDVGDNATKICGLPALSSARLYILPISLSMDGTCTLNHNGSELLHVNWDIQFL